VNTLISLVQQFFRLFVWWVMVAPWEQAIRVRAGKWVTLLGPGPHWKIPVLDKAYVQSIRRRMVNLNMQTLTTTDGKTVTVSGALGYRITDLLKLYQTLHHAEETLRTLALGEIANFVQSHAISDVTPIAILKAVPSALRLDRFGLGDGEIRITSFAVIRAHRLIMDQMWGGDSDRLNTSQAIGVSGPQ
jgi:hypothetical protein